MDGDELRRMVQHPPPGRSAIVLLASMPISIRGLRLLASDGSQIVSDCSNRLPIVYWPLGPTGQNCRVLGSTVPGPIRARR